MRFEDGNQNGVKAFVRPLALAAAVCAGILTAAGAPRTASSAPDPGCTQALAYEKTAAQDSVSAQARYDSAVAGLAANQTCRDAQMHLVNEAYLLSMRAPAEHDLKVGSWQRDLQRANMLLLQCTNWPGIKGTAAGANCATQMRYNATVATNFTATPAPIPAQPIPSGAPASAPSSAPAGASPAPGTSVASPRLGPAVAPPPPPNPTASAAPHG